MLLGQGTGEQPGTPAAASASDGGVLLDAAGSAPILMYHAISEVPVGAASPELFVPPDDFEAEMAWLADQGFECVDNSDGVAGLATTLADLGS